MLVNGILYNSEAQVQSPTKGDWCHTIRGDFELIKESIDDFDEEKIQSMSIKAYKNFMKKKITQSAFEYLEADKETKSKVKNLKYKKLSTQKCLKSEKFKDAN